MVLLTGDKPGSEPETQALCQLIHKIHPAWVVSFHDPSPVLKILVIRRSGSGWRMRLLYLW